MGNKYSEMNGVASFSSLSCPILLRSNEEEFQERIIGLFISVMVSSMVLLIASLGK
jgi:hypothetical protein